MTTLQTHTAGRMPPKLDENSATERLHLMIPRALLSRVNKWRGQLDPIPSQSAAVRMLLERALEAVEEESGPDGGASEKGGDAGS